MREQLNRALGYVTLYAALPVVVLWAWWMVRSDKRAETPR
jgi:hypothetical protein